MIVFLSVLRTVMSSEKLAASFMRSGNDSALYCKIAESLICYLGQFGLHSHHKKSCRAINLNYFGFQTLHKLIRFLFGNKSNKK